MNERAAQFLCGLVLLVILLGRAADAQPVGKWIANGNGNWGDALNWDIQPMIPNGPTAEARFLDSIKRDAVVTINTPIQLNKLVLNNTNDDFITTFKLADGQSFSFAGTSNEIYAPASNKTRHELQAPFEISNSDLTVTNESNQVLVIHGGITEAGGARKLKLQGGGWIVLEGRAPTGLPNNHSGGTDIIATKVSISDNRSLGDVRAPVGLAGGGTLQVYNYEGFSMATRRIHLSGAGGTIWQGTSRPLVLESAISGEGNLTFELANVILRGANTFTGNLTAVGSDVNVTRLTIDSDTALGNTANKLTILGRRGVKLTAENNITSSRQIDFAVNRAPNDTTGSYPFVVDTGRFTVKLGGSITGGGTGSAGMQKIGTGKLILSESSSSTFPGKMQVDRGVLQVDGLLSPTEGVFVNGELKGSGTITGQTFVAKEAKASPAKSPGTLHSIGDVAMEGGSIFDFEVNAATGLAGGTMGWDLWDVDGQLDLTQNLAERIAVRLFSLNSADEPGFLSDFDPTQPYVWPFFATTGGVSGFSPGRFAVNTKHFTTDRAGGRFSIRQIDNNVAVVFTPAPEPSTLLLVVVGLFGLACRIQRPRQ